ncbi:hypothetical protein EJB05_31551, partial [Eragrostis curvula]
MKLLVDTKCHRVLYAEARKDVVDFLFSLLVLRIGTAVNLLGTESMVGSVGNLYASVEKLDDTYIQPGASRDGLLNPTELSPSVGTNGSLFRLSPTSTTPAPPTKFFRCSSGSSSNLMSPFGNSYCYPGIGNSCGNHVTDTLGMTCPSCRNPMDKDVEFLSSQETEQSVEAAAGGSCANGFVKGVVTYTVMDDLKVAPMSTISGITLLNTFGITDIGVLQEKTVQIDYAEGLKILNASLQSKTVLTDVFLAKKSRKA